MTAARAFPRGNRSRVGERLGTVPVLTRVQHPWRHRWSAPLLPGSLAALSLLVVAAPAAKAQLVADYRGGDIGGSITFVMKANPGDTYINIVSVTEGPTCLPPSHPVGCIDVDLNLFWVSVHAPGFFGVMGGSGVVEQTFSMPTDPALDGFLLKDQMIRVVNAKMTEKSELCRILFTLNDTWHDSVGTIGNERAQVPAVPLDDGRILLAGGGGANLDQCEVYDPRTQEYSPVAALNQGRLGHTVTKLADGTVMVAGGSDINLVALSSAEVYDPANNTWTTVGAMGSPRVTHTANLLPDGRVLIAGGSTDVSSVLNAATSAVKTTEYYDPGTQTFSAGPSLARPHTGHSAVTLANGDVVVGGGATWTTIIIKVPSLTNTAQVFSGSAFTFGSELSMKAARVAPGTALLASGKVLFAGGIGGSITSLSDLSSAELFDPAGPSFATTGSMSIARATMAALLLPASGDVLVAGGTTGTDITNPSPTDVVERFDPNSGTFTLAASLALPRAAPGAIVLQNGLAALFGGVGVASPAALYRE
jgi:hypothetical protein